MISEHQTHNTLLVSPLSGKLQRIGLLGLFSSVAFLLAACTDSYSVRDANFGDSVRYTVALQTADADRDAPSLDGVKGEEAMRNYRTFEKIDKPDTVPFTISSGN